MKTLESDHYPPVRYDGNTILMDCILCIHELTGEILSIAPPEGCTMREIEEIDLVSGRVFDYYEGRN